jgi:hypothetical protein
LRIFEAAGCRCAFMRNEDEADVDQDLARKGIECSKFR